MCRICGREAAAATTTARAVAGSCRLDGIKTYTKPTGRAAACLSWAHKSHIMFHKRSEISWCRGLILYYIVLLHYRNIIMFLYTAHIFTIALENRIMNTFRGFVCSLVPQDLFLLGGFFFFFSLYANNVLLICYGR